MNSKNQSIPMKMCDFEWASAARYMAWLEVNVGIEQVNYSQVFSFRIGRAGVAGLKAQKRRQLSKVYVSKAAVEAFAGEHKGALSNEELVVLRSLYHTYNAAIETLKRQLERLEVMARIQVDSLLREEGGQEDEPLF